MEDGLQPEASTESAPETAPNTTASPPKVSSILKRIGNFAAGLTIGFAIRQTPWLDWQLLTKRPQLIADKLPSDWNNGYANVWLGTSVEDDRVLERIYDLASVPAAVHFLSVEPLIGPITRLPLGRIDWVIVGGESGPGARPMEHEWVQDIRQQCRQAEVAFFFKQWGGTNMKKAGRELDGEFYNEMPSGHLRCKQSELPQGGALVTLKAA